MDYIYAQLNNQLNVQSSDSDSTKIKANDYITPVTNNSNETELIVNVSNLVRLYQNKNDSDTSDQTLQLYGYNSDTKVFDLPLGTPIQINPSIKLNTRVTNVEAAVKDLNNATAANTEQLATNSTRIQAIESEIKDFSIAIKELETKVNNKEQCTIEKISVGATELVPVNRHVVIDTIPVDILVNGKDELVLDCIKAKP